MCMAYGFTLIYEPWRVPRLAFGYHKLRIKRAQRLVLPKWFFIACIREGHMHIRQNSNSTLSVRSYALSVRSYAAMHFYNKTKYFIGICMCTARANSQRHIYSLKHSCVNCERRTARDCIYLSKNLFLKPKRPSHSLPRSKCTAVQTTKELRN